MAATLITIGGNILGRLFGFGREAVIAGYFGTSAILDTFILAFTLPELLGMVFF
jgi:putative peptidoglycan lipid II flippase